MQNRTISLLALAAAATVAIASIDVDPSFGRGGGGMRGGGGGMRGGGGGFRGGGVRSGGATSVSRSRPSQLPAGGGSRQRAAQRPAGGTNGSRVASGGTRASQLPAGGNRINNGNVGNRVNTGDVNFNRNTNIDGGWGNWADHPVGAGLVVGAAVGATAAAAYGYGYGYGSYYYDLPAGCPPYYWGGFTYYSCGGAYYEPRYEGSNVTYVTVPDPKAAVAEQQPAAGGAPQP